MGLIIGGMVAAYLVSRWLFHSPKSRHTMAIAVGLRNSSLVLFVASTLLNSQKMALIVVVYGSFCFFSKALLGWLLRKYSPS